MALIDFGMKARRELAEMTERYESIRHWERILEARWRLQKAMREGVSQRLADRETALEEIANSTAKAGSAVRLANIARKALGRPVGGGDE